jgi:hypothetical protein
MGQDVPQSEGEAAMQRGRYLSPVMIGRDAELSSLQAGWQTAGVLVAVRGSAGIGKSRLVREFGAWVKGRGGGGSYRSLRSPGL